MTTRVITLWRENVKSITMTMSTKRFLVIPFLKAMKFHFIGSYDKQNLTLASFHMKFMILAEGLFQKFQIE